MKKTHLNAPGWTIFLAILTIMPMGGYAGDVPTGTQDGGGAGILFKMDDSPRLLEEIEDCREELPLLRALEDKNSQLDEVRIEREAMLRERIGFLEKQQSDLLRMNETAIKQAEVARKAGEGKWYEKLLTTVKWMGPALLAVLVVGATR